MRKISRLFQALLCAFIFCSPLFAQEANEANYDENKVPQYTLPPLLTSIEGQSISTAKQWEQIRRPELMKLFCDQMFGYFPEGKIKVVYKKLDDTHNALQGQATRKQIEITFTRDTVVRRIRVLMYLPNQVKTKVPVFLCPNFKGNQTVNNDAAIIPTSAEERGVASSRWAIEKILEAGFGIVTFHYFDIYPDNAKMTGQSVLALFGVRSMDDLKGNSGDAISAWAWGESRILDYLETDSQVDASKVIIMGHSRLGKTALWAGATDKRFAMVISNESGCGGAALSRRAYGETVNRITHVFPHWFCKNFTQYSKNENALPTDQHELIALIAPRPIYVASAEGDRWSDPKGEFLSASIAGEVYHLYGYKGLETDVMPGVNSPIVNRVAYHIRPGKHDVTDYDWEQYIAFAQKWLK